MKIQFNLTYIKTKIIFFGIGALVGYVVFHPYTMLKDHRTDFETSNGDAVMDGKLDEFIEAYLKQNVAKN